MPQLLRDPYSTEVHLNAARRHIRMCQQHNTASLVAAILPAVRTLQAKAEASRLARMEREDAQDDLIQADNDLDNGVRALFEQARQIQRENPIDNSFQQLFPSGKYSAIVRSPLEEETTQVAQIGTRINSLPENHPLRASGVTLAQKLEKTITCLTTLNEAIRKLKLAEAEEEIAQAALRRQYEINYLDARAEYGKVFAERLFPSIISRSFSDVPETETETKLKTES